MLTAGAVVAEKLAASCSDQSAGPGRRPAAPSPNESPRRPHASVGAGLGPAKTCLGDPPFRRVHPSASGETATDEVAIRKAAANTEVDAFSVELSEVSPEVKPHKEQPGLTDVPL